MPPVLCDPSHRRGSAAFGILDAYTSRLHRQAATLATQPPDAQTDQSRTSIPRRKHLGYKLVFHNTAMSCFVTALVLVATLLTVPVIAADDGDDFSNNLFSDLAP